MDINLIIARFLLGEASYDERQNLKTWISEDAANKKYFSEIEQLFNALEINFNIDKIDSEDAWKIINKKLSQKSSSNENEIKRRLTVKSEGRYKMVRIAAMILLLIGFSFSGAYVLLEKKFNTDISYNEITVPNGSKTYLVLNDGTKVWLNSMSKLRYPGEFNPTSREVFLDGEAYFEVAKDKQKPFYVITSDIDIKVHGTSFNVKSYKNEGTIETTLEEGSISITRKNPSHKTEDIFLKPSQRLTFVKAEGEIMVDDIKELLKEEKQTDNTEKKVQRKEKLILAENINTEIYTAWKDNKLIFEDESFESLAVKLERWYDVKIQLKGDKLNQFRFTGTFENETVEQALKALQITTKFNYSLDHNLITIEYK